MASQEKVFQIVDGPGEMELMFAYFRGRTNYQGLGGTAATFTIVCPQDTNGKGGHSSFEVHSFTRVPSCVNGHMLTLEGRWNVSTAHPCHLCGCTEGNREHVCRVEGFYDTKSRRGFLKLSDFQFTDYFTVEPGTKRVLRIDDSRQHFDVFTGELVPKPRLR